MSIASRPAGFSLSAVTLAVLLFPVALGCAPEPAASGTGGAKSASGGSGSGGATSSGGAPGSGGAVVGSGGSDSGGATSTGGTSGSGGSGGAVTGSGGSSGGSSGGQPGTGGKAGGSGAGTGGAAGMPGGGGTSGGMAATGCAGKGYKLCEDFESGTVGGFPTGWSLYKGYGAGAAKDVGLATDQFHSGSKALKSDSAATGQGRAQMSLSALGATASKHWGRVFYKVQYPAVKPASGVLHVTFVGLIGSVENRVVDIVEDSSGKHQWLYNNPDDKGSLGSAYSWTFDADWHCAEWYIDVSAKAYRFFTDSKEVTSIAFTGKTDAEMSNYSKIVVGSTYYQTPPSSFIMWFDDLAINDTQIGCQ